MIRFGIIQILFALMWNRFISFSIGGLLMGVMSYIVKFCIFFFFFGGGLLKTKIFT